MSDKNRRRPGRLRKTTYVWQSESDGSFEPRHDQKRRKRIPKQKHWDRQKRQLQQMDIEDLRQYVVETDGL